MIATAVCFDCKHFYDNKDEKNFRCDAFPDGVPDEIGFGFHDHKTPYPGDNGILFEPKEGASLKTLPTNAEARASRKELLALMLGEKN